MDEIFFFAKVFPINHFYFVPYFGEIEILHIKREYFTKLSPVELLITVNSTWPSFNTWISLRTQKYYNIFVCDLFNVDNIPQSLLTIFEPTVLLVLSLVFSTLSVSPNSLSCLVDLPYLAHLYCLCLIQKKRRDRAQNLPFQNLAEPT